ncbi:hypothetical protein NL676_024411 [Syzygium grande]|nr:hypothetical protein NL676_024411 [Syzygium grande]
MKMASSRVFLPCGLLLAVLVLVAAQVSARELAEEGRLGHLQPWRKRGMEAAMTRVMAATATVVTATVVMAMAVITVVTLQKKLKMSRIR